MLRGLRQNWRIPESQSATILSCLTMDGVQMRLSVLHNCPRNNDRLPCTAMAQRHESTLVLPAITDTFALEVEGNL